MYSGRRPDFFIIGAPKCGTTSLHRWLIGHPQVFMPARPKEPHYFIQDRMANFGMRYLADLEPYLALFSSGRAHGARRAGEASTTYLEAPQVPSRIHDFNPEARLIAMLRDPVTMVASLHAMRVSQGLEPISDLAAALEEERERPGFGVVGDQSSIRYRDRARFSVMLPRWQDTFGRERVHVVILDDMAASPAHEFRRVLEFLDVDPAYKPVTFDRHNEREWPRSMILARAQRRLRRPWVARSPADRMVRHAYRLIGRLNRRDVPPRRMPADLRLQLRDDFSTEVDQLSALLGRDLRQLWWTESQ